MSKARLLIVEDDYAIVRGLKDSFSHCGYQVSTAMDGEAAIQVAKQDCFDLILLDIMLPKRNGFEVCQAIREAAIETPIIMLTAKGEEADVVRGLNIGADDYIAKPFSIKQLQAKCAAFLRRYQKTQVQVYEFGGYCLDFNSRQLKLCENNQIIKLTPKEYELLKLFIRREGRAITRETILNAVWGSHVFTTTRSVDRCVNTLRKKIEKNSVFPQHIISVRNVGYRFKGNAEEL